MSIKPLRVLLVEASGRGFLSHYTHALAYGLHRVEMDVHLLTGKRDELHGWSVPFKKQACLETGYRGWRCVRRQIQQVQPDVVHLQWVDNPLQAIRLVRWAQRRGIKVIYTPHNILPHERRWLLMPAYKVLYRKLDSVVARDKHLVWALDELLDTPHDQVTLLPGSPNYLALASPENRPCLPVRQKQQGEHRLLFFGHGCHRKGLDKLLTTVACNEWPSSMHLIVAGEGVLQAVPSSLLQAARRAMKFTLIDRYVAPEEVAALFRESDLLLMPYIKQCKSPLLDLAAALRLPVLRSDRVQGAEFIEGVHGVTYSHDDHAAMERWLKQTQWLDDVRKRLDGLDDPLATMDALADGHRALYRNLCGLREGRGNPGPVFDAYVSAAS